MYTYKKPVAKIAVVKIFLLSDIFSFQTDGTGRIKIAKSETTLKIPLAWKVAQML